MQEGTIAPELIGSRMWLSVPTVLGDLIASHTILGRWLGSLIALLFIGLFDVYLVGRQLKRA